MIGALPFVSLCTVKRRQEDAMADITLGPQKVSCDYFVETNKAGGTAVSLEKKKSRDSCRSVMYAY